MITYSLHTVLCISLTLAVASSPGVGAASTSNTCPGDALEQLHQYNVNSGPFAYLNLAITKQNLWGYVNATYAALAAQAPPDSLPPVLLLPTNHALSKWIVDLKLSSNPKNWTGNSTDLFKIAIANHMVPWRQAKRHWPAYFVRDTCVLLGMTYDMTQPLRGMRLQLWNGRGPGLSGSRPSYRPASSKGRKLLQDVAYGVTGQGYNTLTGYPFYYQGMDPGFTFNPIFDLTQAGVGEYQNTTTCSEAIETSLLFNGAQLSSQAVNSIKVPSAYAQAAFTQNPEYAYLAGSAAVNQVIAVPSITTVTTGGWEVNAAAPVLDQYYITAVTNLADAYGTSSYQNTMKSFAEAYGFTYVESVYYGAYTNTLEQMTSPDFGSIQYNDVDIYSQQPSMFQYAGGAYTCSGACPDFDNDAAQLIEDYGEPQQINCMQSPLTIPVPFTSIGGIDCTTYANSAESAWNEGQAVPVTYYLGDQYTLLTNSAFLFPSSIQTVLPSVANDLKNYFATCSNTDYNGVSVSLCPASSACPTLSFLYNDVCVMCYDQTTSVSPMCYPDFATTVKCAVDECFCGGGGIGGHDYDSSYTNCFPVLEPYSGPPAPKNITAGKRRRRLRSMPHK